MPSVFLVMNSLKTLFSSRPEALKCVMLHDFFFRIRRHLSNRRIYIDLFTNFIWCIAQRTHLLHITIMLGLPAFMFYVSFLLTLKVQSKHNKCKEMKSS